MKIDYKNQDFSSINYTYLALSIIPLILFILLQGLRFNSLLESPLKKKELFSVQFRLQFFNLIFPGGFGGDVYRVFLLKHSNESLTSLTSKSIIDRLTGLLVISAMFVYALFDIQLPVKMEQTMFAISLMAILLGTAVCIVMLARLWRGLALLKRGLQLVVVSYGCWIAQIFRLWLLCLAIKIHFSMAEMAFMLGVLQLASLLPITIGGLGIIEGAFIFVADILGISLPLAALGAVLMRITTMVSGLLGFWLWLQGKRA